MRGSEGGRQKTEERGKGQDGARGGRRKMRRRRRGGDGCGVYNGIGEFRPCGMGGSVWSDGGRGREEGREVKKDTKARRESLNDKRSGQLGLGRRGPKGAAG